MTEITLETRAKAVLLFDATGRTISFEEALAPGENSAGRITATHLPNGQVRRYQYDKSGNLNRVQPDAQNPQGTLEIARDLWGRPVKMTQGGLSVELQYDAAGRLTTLINENAAQSQFTWDALDRLTEEVGFDGRVQRNRYDAAGQLTQSSDGTGQAGDLVTHYQYDQIGRLTERHLAATQAGHGQSQRFEWDAAGRLKAAIAQLLIPEAGQQQPQKQLQSRVEFERDPLGRITAETQRLYQAQPSGPGQTLPIEYEHRIEHQLDPLGNRQASKLQSIGEVQWLLYGSGHVHGITHEGQSLIDFEHDSLHRETQRTLHGIGCDDGDIPLNIHRHYDSLGRLGGIDLQGLRGQSLPPILIGQLTNRQYHYDALSQLIAIEMPGQTLGYGYDTAGRLRSQARYDSSAWLRAVGGKVQAQTLQRWDIDPAGNRLPGKVTTEQQQQQSWGQQVHRRWQEPEFNLLGQGSAPKQQPGKVDQWPGNRIGFTEDSAWRYDQQGNRVEQMREHGNGQYSRQQLFYDGANQLTAVQVDGTDGQGGSAMLNTTGYIYDALGRRLKKSSKDQNGKTHITYFGWDGDRQVHTETLSEDGDRDIVHTVYEPGTFTPMVRLSTKAKGQHQAKPPLMVQAGLAGLPPEMMSGIPGQAQKDIENIMRQVLTGPLTPMSRRIMSNMGINPDALIEKMRGKVEEIKQAERTDITVHYFHCDHLGTPLALTDQQGNIAWAVEYDPWGNIEEEFNPSDIEQNIRLPGQYCDKETGLYYNRHRYYDPKIGAYINQDPAGLRGSANLYGYVAGNPLIYNDPLGLTLWTGNMYSVGATAPVGATYSYIKLTSECVNGKQAHVVVQAVGPSAGVGIKAPPLGGSLSNVTFNDFSIGLDPNVFNDIFTTAGLGLALGAEGFNYSVIKLGDAQTSGLGGEAGLDTGASVTFGSSTVTSSSITCGCK